jgi:copper(I)-binding protein
VTTAPTRAARTGAILAAVALVTTLGLSACGDDDDSAAAQSTVAGPAIEVTDAWARTTPMDATASAAYMSISNTGDADDTLIAASVDDTIAGQVELHETRSAASDTAGTVSTTGETGTPASSTTAPPMEMVAVERIVVPAGETTSLEPGGYHVMLLDLLEPLAEGSEVELTLTFEQSGEIVVGAVVGDAAHDATCHAPRLVVTSARSRDRRLRRGPHSGSDGRRPRALDDDDFARSIHVTDARPRGQRDAHRGQRLVVGGTKLEEGVRRDGQGDTGVHNHRLFVAGSLAAAPHLTAPAQEVPHLHEGAMSHRHGGLARWELEVSHAGAVAADQQTHVRAVRRDGISQPRRCSGDHRDAPCRLMVR